MRRIKLLIQSEDAQARLVIAGFFIMFAIIALLAK
jgi:hypothetical protein